MLSDQKDLLALFNAHGVRYMIVGAHAVGVHSEPPAPRTWTYSLKASSPNAEKVFAALAEFGAPLAGMSAADFNDKPGSVFQIGVPPGRIDILQRIEGVDFEQAWLNRIDTSLSADLPVHVISSADLVRNKLAVARPQDLIDVEKFREAEEVNKHKS